MSMVRLLESWYRVWKCLLKEGRPPLLLPPSLMPSSHNQPTQRSDGPLKQPPLPPPQLSSPPLMPTKQQQPSPPLPPPQPSPPLPPPPMKPSRLLIAPSGPARKNEVSTSLFLSLCLIVLTSFFLAGPEGAIRRRDAFIGGGGSGGGGCCCLVGIRGGDDSCGDGSGGCVAASFVVNHSGALARMLSGCGRKGGWRGRANGVGG